MLRHDVRAALLQPIALCPQAHDMRLPTAADAGLCGHRSLSHARHGTCRLSTDMPCESGDRRCYSERGKKPTTVRYFYRPPFTWHLGFGGNHIRLFTAGLPASSAILRRQLIFYRCLSRASASMRACLARISVVQVLLMKAKDAAISSSVKRFSKVGISV